MCCYNPHAVLDLKSIKSSAGKHQGRPTSWMDSTGKEVTLWQQMLERPNFWVEGAALLRPPDRIAPSSQAPN